MSFVFNYIQASELRLGHQAHRLSRSRIDLRTHGTVQQRKGHLIGDRERSDALRMNFWTTCPHWEMCKRGGTEQHHPLEHDIALFNRWEAAMLARLTLLPLILSYTYGRYNLGTKISWHRTG
jgi:hypothetical protein